MTEKEAVNEGYRAAKRERRMIMVVNQDLGHQEMEP
jgi:hypothetical protein